MEERMTNPFQDIKNKHELDERKRIESKRESDLREQQKYQAQRISEQYYEGMVMQVLQQLKEAVYPSYYKVSKSNSFPVIWEIGTMQSYVNRDGDQYSQWESFVGVSLLYNENNQPIAFSCGRKGNKDGAKGNLTEQDLIAALQSLYID
jgi:hypothetical protein